MSQSPAQPERSVCRPCTRPAAGIKLIPEALRDGLTAEGIPPSGAVLEAAELLVAGTLAPRSRFRYGRELGQVSRWCAEHGLSLLDLSPMDVGALVVVRRDAGQSPRLMLSALAFVYSNKRDPDPSVCELAWRVNKVWLAQNRDRLRPRLQAPVLPLLCWEAMHAAVGDPERVSSRHALAKERLSRNRLVIALGITGGLRPGEFGRLSASGARIDAGKRLRLPLIPGGNDAVTKTGRGEIVVPVGSPPFDVLPLAEDFERLRRLRLERGGDDHLIAGAWHRGMLGGLSYRQIGNILREAARMAGIEDAQALTGYSLRRSMVHISAAAGWTLDQMAVVLGHNSHKTLEDHYLEGYGGSWCRSGEGRELLLEGTRGWADCPPNAKISATATGAGARSLSPWWHGRDLAADRRCAQQLARSTPRVSSTAASEIALIGRRWEEFCARVGANPANPSQALLEGFATSLTKDSTAERSRALRYLTDYFAALPSTDLNDLAEIRCQVAAAVRLGGAITAANRRKGWTGPRRREIVRVTDGAMEAVFAQPLVARFEGIRLLGVVLDQSQGTGMNRRQREAFCFGKHARITPQRALLFAPGSQTTSKQAPALTVAPNGGDPLWCGHEAVRRLVEHYPQNSLASTLPPDAMMSRCTPMVRWLQARAAVAIAYATGLRPTDLDGIRWPDLLVDNNGAIMWRLPYSKGNLSGSRTQVLRLLPSDSPWCPVRALQRLELSLRAARDAGWQGRDADPDSDGVVRKVFVTNISHEVISKLMKPAGLDLRLCDFRYHEAARTWEQTRDMQIVRAAMFHRRASTSAGYVARGMTSDVRAETDPMSGMFTDMDGAS